MSLNPGRSIEALVKVTSIGVERQKPAELLSKLLPTEADLFAAIPQSDAAAFTLTALAILDAYASAGFVAPMAKNKLPSAAEPEAESSSGVSPALAAALREALSLQSPALLREALQQMALRGKRIPAELLADVMQQALQQESIIESLRPCLGARGRWLSELNPQWQALVSAGPQASDVEWQEGTLAQRCEYFRVLRQQDAERSRAVWQSDVQALPAKERLALLEIVAEDLSAADEDLIQSVLADRSREVRQLGMSLLARLPSSAFAQRMGQRLRACFEVKKGMLKTSLLIEPPEQFDKQWKLDGLEEKSGQTSKQNAKSGATSSGMAPIGERAFWLQQLACYTPLEVLPRQLGFSPQELLAYAAKSDWHQVLILGWAEACISQRNPEWALAISKLPNFRKLAIDQLAILTLLAPDARAELVLTALKTPGDQALSTLYSALSELARDVDGYWQPRLAEALLRYFAAHICDKSQTYDYSFKGCLLEAALLIPPSSLAGLSAVLSAPATSAEQELPKGLEEAISNFSRILQLRQIIFKELGGYERR